MKIQTLQKLIDNNLTPRDAIVLLRLNEVGVTTPRMLVTDKICAASITGIADKLIKLGFVNRERSATDRRSVSLNITERGRVLVNGY